MTDYEMKNFIQRRILQTSLMEVKDTLNIIL